MAREIFVDASAWVALAEKDDNHHAEAAKIYPRLLKEYQRLVTTNLVIAEAHVSLRHQLGFTGAMSFLIQIRLSRRILRVHSDEELETQAESILRKYDDQDFSYADAVSFALMKKRGITDVFTFDHHFRTAGFHLVGERSKR